MDHTLYCMQLLMMHQVLYIVLFAAIADDFYYCTCVCVIHVCCLCLNMHVCTHTHIHTAGSGSTLNLVYHAVDGPVKSPTALRVVSSLTCW